MRVFVSTVSEIKVYIFIYIYIIIIIIIIIEFISDNKDTYMYTMCP